MQTTTLSFANMHEHGSLFSDLLRARHRLFIQHKGWELPNALGMEFDQYDTPMSRWVVVHDETGTVLAGTRLTPTTAACGIYSYMIRDAQRGLLPTIPDTLLFDAAPVADDIWESSRLFVSHDIPARQRALVHANLSREMVKAVSEIGARACLGLIHSNWPRWAPRIGLDMEAAGPVMEIEGDRVQVTLIRASA